jgi:hypothetical protein
VLAVGSLAGRINGKYGEVSWTPIRYVNRVWVAASSQPSTCAGLRTPTMAPVTAGQLGFMNGPLVTSYSACEPGCLGLFQNGGCTRVEFQLSVCCTVGYLFAHAAAVSVNFSFGSILGK